MSDYSYKKPTKGWAKKPKAKKTSAAMAVKTELLRMAETKYKHTYTTPYAVSNGSTTIWKLTGIAQGDGISNREGDHVHITRIEWKAIISAGDATNILRLGIVRSKHTGTLADVGSIWYPENGSGTYYNGIYPDGLSADYQVMMDRTYVLVGGTDRERKVVKWNHKVDKDCYFDATDTTGNGEGHLWFMAVSDSGSTPHPNIEFQITVYYKDF